MKKILLLSILMLTYLASEAQTKPTKAKAETKANTTAANNNETEQELQKQFLVLQKLLAEMEKETLARVKNGDDALTVLLQYQAAMNKEFHPLHDILAKYQSEIESKKEQKQ